MDDLYKAFHHVHHNFHKFFSHLNNMSYQCVAIYLLGLKWTCWSSLMSTNSRPPFLGSDIFMIGLASLFLSPYLQKVYYMFQLADFLINLEKYSLIHPNSLQSSCAVWSYSFTPLHSTRHSISPISNLGLLSQSQTSKHEKKAITACLYFVVPVPQVWLHSYFG